jgi:uncharacterized protein YndB with AHSA1/START domain
VIVDGEIVVERRIRAPVADVFAYLVDGAKWARWQGIAADLEARPGGGFAVEMPGGQVASGYFVDVVPNRRVVFTWGWSGDEAVPPGSSTVEIELLEEGRETVVRLRHRGLPAAAVEIHATGWDRYVRRLGEVAEGRDPGVDAPIA